ncbi:hypothetical protein Leryth_018455 [Lithospermum erythrorhizon]|nr:hypothetical protein Leryth_018455 [Lithospermum erythrorhizon]
MLRSVSSQGLWGSLKWYFCAKKFVPTACLVVRFRVTQPCRSHMHRDPSTRLYNIQSAPLNYLQIGLVLVLPPSFGWKCVAHMPEAYGGHGYAAFNRFGSLRNDNDIRRG